MVATRSGKVTDTSVSTSQQPSHGTRSRKKDSRAEDIYADVGQPEVSSPAVKTASKVAPDSPSQGFGSPVQAPLGLQTPVQRIMADDSYQERLVKTVGKTVPQTPSMTPAAKPRPVVTAPTPSAKEMQQIASIPLPDDAGTEETEPFASSEDELTGPASPPKAPQAAPSRAPRERPARKSARLLWTFALTSLLLTLGIGFLLAPCANPALYAELQSPAYERLCKTLLERHRDLRIRTEDLSWRVRAEVADQLGPLYAKLPPSIHQVVDKTWGPMADAHTAAWSAFQTLLEQANERTASLQQTAKEIYLRLTRQAFLSAAPLMQKAWSRVNQLLPASSAAAATAQQPHSHVTAATAPTALSLGDFLSVVDQSPEQQQYVQELWAAAGRQIADKQKAVAWVLACRHETECAATMNALLRDASTFVHIDGASFSSHEGAGTLQSELVNYLKAYPAGLVLVSSPARMHSNCVSVINAAISESGHLQMDGEAVETKRALYVFVVEDAAVEGVEAEADIEKGVKDRLCEAIASVGPQTASAPATILSFRRRLDAVLPARKVSPPPAPKQEDAGDEYEDEEVELA